MTEFQKQLKKLKACSPGRRFVGKMSFTEAWVKFTQPDWMIWLMYKMPERFEKVKKADYVRIALFSAQCVRPLIEDEELAENADKCLRAGRAWLINPTLENKAAVAATVVAPYDLSKPYVDICAAESADDAACAVVSHAAHAADDAAHATDGEANQKICDYIREIIKVKR